MRHSFTSESASIAAKLGAAFRRAMAEARFARHNHALSCRYCGENLGRPDAAITCPHCGTTMSRAALLPSKQRFRRPGAAQAVERGALR